MSNRRGGLISLKVDGIVHECAGAFEYNFGEMKRTSIVGHDGVHGFTELPQVPYISGEITDRSDLDVKKLLQIDGATITLSLANGKIAVLRDAWYAGDGKIGTEAGNIEVRFEGKSGDEVR